MATIRQLSRPLFLSFVFFVDSLMWPDATKHQELLAQQRKATERRRPVLAKHREAVRRMIDLRLDPAIVQRLDASDVVQEVLIEANRRLKDYLKAPDDAVPSLAAAICRTTSSTPIAAIIRPKNAASIANSRCNAPPGRIGRRSIWPGNCSIRFDARVGRDSGRDAAAFT